MSVISPPTSGVKNAIAFFDGQNLFQHAKEAFGHYHPNYDPIALHEAVCKANGWRRTLTRFYSGVPDEYHDPVWAKYWSNRVLAMKRAGILVTTRPLRYRTKSAFNKNGIEEEIVVPQEKGIDVRIALDVVSGAIRNQYNVAILFSQDQDLREIVQETKDISKISGKQIEIVCAFPDSPDASSKRGIDGTTWFRMDRTFYDACLDTRDYRPKR